jgi:outer membrane receptor protein involved in Fe transport
MPAPSPEPGKDVVDKNVKNVAVPGVSLEDFHPWHLVVFSNVQFLDAVFTESQIPGQVGKTPAFAPNFLWKGGLTFGKEHRFNTMLSAVYSSEQFWSDADIAIATTPAKLPAYAVVNLSGEWYFTKHARLIAGISNLADEQYYSRVFFNGSIEPSPGRSGYAGVSLEF